jgi:hypothetical protein
MTPTISEFDGFGKVHSRNGHLLRFDRGSEEA